MLLGIKESVLRMGVFVDQVDQSFWLNRFIEAIWTQKSSVFCQVQVTHAPWQRRWNGRPEVDG